MSEPVILRHRRPCPICKKQSQQKFHPFCSNRCADSDLSRWLDGRYAIPTHEGEDEAQTAATAADNLVDR